MRDFKDWEGNLIPPLTFGEQAFIHQLTTLQRANSHLNKVAYAPPLTEVTGRRAVAPALNIIIPVKGRADHLKLSLASLNASIQLLNSDAAELVTITVAEMDVKPLHREISFECADYYLYIKSETFNKSLLMNTAANSFTTDVFLFYDVDLIVETQFIQQLMQYCYTLIRKDSLMSFVLQPIYERKIFYVKEDLTNKLFAGEITVNDLRDGRFMDDIYVQPTWHHGNYPPGGAIAVTKNLFHSVGGYDPELFWGYSPEDRLFLQNCMVLSGGQLHAPNDRTIGRMYHLYHPNSETTNLMYEHMVALEQMIAAHPAARTCYLINKHILGNVPSGDPWPDFLGFLGDTRCWTGEGACTPHGSARLKKLSLCKHRLIEMMLQWWCFQEGGTDKNTGVSTLRLGYRTDTITTDVRIKKALHETQNSEGT